MDWRDVRLYTFDPALSRAEWAWQFLRRNAEYQADYGWFISTWRALEADYGTPPGRDYFRWKQDPRAWRSEREIESCPEDVCPGVGDLVLIECWMGAKWGLRKFPPDPALTRPILEEELAWREVALEMPELESGDAPWLQQRPGRIGLGFDLGLPLADQLELAKRQLVARRRAMEKSGHLPGHRLTDFAPLWQRWLRLLDAAEAGASLREIGVELGTANTMGRHAGLGEEIRQARSLVAADYRQILLMED